MIDDEIRRSPLYRSIWKKIRRRWLDINTGKSVLYSGNYIAEIEKKVEEEALEEYKKAVAENKEN